MGRLLGSEDNLVGNEIPHELVGLCLRPAIRSLVLQNKITAHATRDCHRRTIFGRCAANSCWAALLRLNAMNTRTHCIKPSILRMKSKLIPLRLDELLDAGMHGNHTPPDEFLYLQSMSPSPCRRVRRTRVSPSPCPRVRLHPSSFILALPYLLDGVNMQASNRLEEIGFFFNLHSSINHPEVQNGRP